MEFQLSYFKSWKMMLWKCWTQYARKFGKTQQWPPDWKRSVFIPIPKKGNAKEYSKYISHASKVMLKILQARLQQYVNYELPYVQAGFRKGRGIRYQISNTPWIIEETRELQKNHLLLLYWHGKIFDCMDHNCGKCLKWWDYQTTLPASWETCMQVKKQQLESDMEQQTGSIFERSMSRLYTVTLLI